MGNNHSTDNIFNITKVKENNEEGSNRGSNRSTKNQKSGTTSSADDRVMIVQKFDVDDESFDDSSQALFRKTDRPRSPDAKPLAVNAVSPKGSAPGKNSPDCGNKAAEAKYKDNSLGKAYSLVSLISFFLLRVLQCHVSAHAHCR